VKIRLISPVIHLPIIDDWSILSSMTENTRDRLIAASMQLMAVKGFNNTGIAEILNQVNVPKGSFYHYFKSKDDLGLAIIDLYGQQLRQGLEGYLAGASGSALSRLRAYFDSVLVYFGGNIQSCNCLLGNLAQELSLQNPIMRDAIFSHYRALEQLIADCLRQARAEGELVNYLDEQLLARMFFASWEGSLVRARLEQSAQPLNDVLEMYFSSVFPDKSIEDK